MRKQRIVSVILCVTCISMLLGCSASATVQNTFEDVTEDAWYSEAVQYVYENGIMNGVSKERFAPDETVLRGMLVTILHRMEGEPAYAGSSSFKDVRAGSYCEKAVLWAAEQNIVTGYDDTSFGPDNGVTREQVAAILYRYTQYKGIPAETRGDLSKYGDAERVSSFALDAMSWAEGTGLITGTGSSMLNPKGLTTRAQMATIIMRYETSIGKEETASDGGTGKDAPKTYTVVFEDYDGSVLKREIVNAGDNAVPPTVPVRQGYTFTGWSRSYTAVSSDLTLVAQYERGGDISGELPPLAEDVGTVIFAENAIASPGENVVEVAVQIKNNPGILGMTLMVSYDESVVTLTDAKSGKAVKNVLTLTKPGRFEPQCCFVWDGTELTDTDIQDGEILVLTFKVADTASAGTYPIVLFSSKNGIVDNMLSPVGVAFQNGSITFA